jgi:hypothetical protein
MADPTTPLIREALRILEQHLTFGKVLALAPTRQTCWHCDLPLAPLAAADRAAHQALCHARGDDYEDLDD